MADRQERQFSAKWDVRTGSPRKLWRALHDFLDEHHFQNDYEELKLEDSPIEGTATFSDWLTGFRDRDEAAPLAFLRVGFGVLFCMSLVLIPVGLPLIRSSRRKIRTWATVSVEGEVYRTRGADIQSAHAAEAIDVVADARITLVVIAGEASESDDYEMKQPASSRRDSSRLNHDFSLLQHNLDIILPRQTLPSVELLD